MIIQKIKNNFTEAGDILEAFISGNKNWDAIEKAGEMIAETVNNNKKVITCGNGGSMSDAMHFTEEFTGCFRKDRRPLPSVAICDPSYITCAANDYGFESVFARYIEGLGNEGDILLAISTSGNSPNIVNAAEKAKEKGLFVIGLTGKDGGNLSKLCDIEIRSPYSEYSDRTQEIHIKILHSLIHYVELKLNL